jgi:excisionase family DNA binding protein
MATGLRKMTYSVEEAATVLGVSTSKIYDSVRNGELRAVQLGRRVVIPSDVLEALLGPLDTSDRPASSPVPSTTPVPELRSPDRRGAQLNAVHLSGTIVRDPQLRLSRTGLEVCTLQLAVARRRRDGEARGVLHVDVVTFGAVAEAAGDLARGQHVAVSGRLGQREWTSKDGSQHARFEVVADEVEVIRRSEQE